MAQHRTKEDKQHAQIHRIEQMKTYSLDTIGFAQTLKVNPTTITTEHTFGVQMNHVRADLFRTLISTIIVLALLSAGVYFLR